MEDVIQAVAAILATLKDVEDSEEVDDLIKRLHLTEVEKLLEATLAFEPKADEKMLCGLVLRYFGTHPDFEDWAIGWLGSQDEEEVINLIQEVYLRAVV